LDVTPKTVAGASRCQLNFGDASRFKNGFLETAKDAVLILLQRKYRQRWTKDELIFFHEKFVLPLQKLLPSGEKRGRPPKHTFQEILSNLC
jgi:hypothetical protein